MALRKCLSNLILILFVSLSVNAEELSIHVQGLFKNTAIVKINGVDRVLKVGKVSPEGVELRSANSREAIILFKGKERRLTMGSSASIGFNAASEEEKDVVSSKMVTLSRQLDGMFHASGTINGTSVNFLVDTGASTIAMNHLTANRIGIPYRVKGNEISVVTASGVVEAYRVYLDKVRIGDLVVNNIEGAVLVGEQPDKVLLGMSFLNKFKMQQNGNQLVIETN
ncbi:retropepsin-like aspartic protease family protein [Pleionea sediminis]|uniref:retropepsin-like aspartic protease family protein n=1 Tax=Pleionea sediminis TaxID=2569479 RepID=UPI0011846ABC|nr:TIGR02281 family clan AA aspartic protease [Pleionea sediminis]